MITENPLLKGRPVEQGQLGISKGGGDINAVGRAGTWVWFCFLGLTDVFHNVLGHRAYHTRGRNNDTWWGAIT